MAPRISPFPYFTVWIQPFRSLLLHLSTPPYMCDQAQAFYTHQGLDATEQGGCIGTRLEGISRLKSGVVLLLRPPKLGFQVKVYAYLSFWYLCLTQHPAHTKVLSKLKKKKNTSGETGSERLKNLLKVTQQRKTADLPKGKEKLSVTEQDSGQGAIHQGRVNERWGGKRQMKLQEGSV